MSGLFGENEVQKCRIHRINFMGMYEWNDGFIMDGKVYFQEMNNELLFPEMAKEECEDRLTQFEVDGKWGYFDIYSGEIKILPRWDYAAAFSAGYAHVVIGAQVNHDWDYVNVWGGKHGYINTKGEIVIPLEYDDAYEYAFGENFKVAKEGKWGLVSKHNKVLIPMIWNNLTRCRVLKGIWYCTRVTEKRECFYGVYNQNFVIIVEPVVERIISPVLKDHPSSKDSRRLEKYVVLKIKRKYGIISSDGRLIANIVLSKKQAEMMLNTISREMSKIYIETKGNLL